MSSPSMDEDLSRVTIISQSRRVDLALPGSVTLSELLPSILSFSGQEPNQATDSVHSWVLQRFGSDPFDLYIPINKLNIRDGETLHLRQREAAIPDAAFDDVVDAVAGATNSRPSWAQRHSRRVGLILLLATLVGIPLLTIVGSDTEDTLLPKIIAIASATLLSFAAFIGAVALARAAGERATATALAWASVSLGGIAGWFLPELLTSDEIPVAIRILMAAALTLIACTASALAAAVHTMPFLAGAVTSTFMIFAGGFMALYYGNDHAVAAVTMTIMAFLTAFLPPISYRLAGIALPNLPVTTEAMLADETPVQSDIVSRAILADRILGGLMAATATTAVLNAMIVIQRGTVWSTLLVGCIGLAFLLRARAFVGLSQKVSLMVAGLANAGMALLALGWDAPNSVTGVVILMGSALALGYVFSHYSASLYAKILSPSWGRWGDIFEWLAIIGIVPALLGVLELYDYFRSLFG